jgi:hypothetical protein
MHEEAARPTLHLVVGESDLLERERGAHGPKAPRVPSVVRRNDNVHKRQGGAFDMQACTPVERPGVAIRDRETLDEVSRGIAPLDTHDRPQPLPVDHRGLRAGPSDQVDRPLDQFDVLEVRPRRDADRLPIQAPVDPLLNRRVVERHAPGRLIVVPIAVVVEPVADLRGSGPNCRHRVVALLAGEPSVRVVVLPPGNKPVAIVIESVADLGRAGVDGRGSVVALGTGKPPVRVSILFAQRGPVAVVVLPVAELRGGRRVRRVAIVAVGAGERAIAVAVVFAHRGTVAVVVGAIAGFRGSRGPRRVGVVAVGAGQ